MFHVGFPTYNAVESVLVTTFTDRVVGFLLNKLESNNEKVRIGTLAIVRHLVNSSGTV